MTRPTTGFPEPSAAVRCAVPAVVFSAAGIKPTAHGQVRLDRWFAHVREKAADPSAGSGA
jgi:hypothetical protein